MKSLSSWKRGVEQTFACWRAVPALLLVLAAAPLASAQGVEATVRGMVTDPSGNGVARALVTVTEAGADAAAGEAQTALTNGDGEFAVGPLAAGSYALLVEGPGFLPHQESFDLGRQQELRLDIGLEYQTFSESVAVESEPGNFVLGEEEIDNLQAADMSQLLANESMVAVGGALPVAQKIYVRGFEDVLLNVTVDGAQQAGELYHHQGRVQIEPEFLKSIELEAGAGPATSGAGALTGALRLTTKDAFDLLEPGRSFGGRVKGTAGLNGEDSFTGSISAYGRLSENLGLVVSALQRDASDYEDGNGDLVESSAAEQQRAHAKLSGVYSDHSFSLSFEDLRDRGTYYERPNLSNFTGAFVLSDHEMNRRTATYNHLYDPAGDAVRVQGTLYWTRADFNNHRNTTGALYGKGEFTSIGLDLRNTSLFGDHSTTYGVEYRSDEASGTQQATPPPFWGSSEQSASVLGVFAQDRWEVSDRVFVSAGLRFDSYEHSTDEGVGAGVSNDSDGFSPNLSVEWQPVQGLTLRAAYARAFRGITIREAFFSALYIHRGDLEPERADNLELGFSYERGGGFVRGTVFRQDFENYINAVFDGGTAWGYWENVGDAEAEGYELEVGRRWRHLSLSAGVWETDNTINDRPLTDADLGLGTNIGRTWTASLDYQVPESTLWFGLRTRLVEDEPNTITEVAPDKEGYFVADLHSAWQPLEQRPLTLHASVTNLFDEFYFDQATYGFSPRSGDLIGFPSKGREVVLSVAYKF
ncbi:MAG: TonB-dependent receptor [Acidobacteriota bacterium]|nr:TonB-dependent receptor [Acidobacteriota bacterium]